MEQRDLHLWLISLLPLAGAAINGFFGKRFPRALVNVFALGSTALAFAMALWVLTQALGGGLTLPYEKNYLPWIAYSGFSVHFGYYLDQLSLVMLMVVTGVGFLIHIYSTGYMADDPGYYRFFCYLNLFMFFMLTLVLANNYLLMFVGWEGVGLASYLLVGFYFLKFSAVQAGKKAFITNRIGDFAFLLGMFMIIKTFGSLDYSNVLPRAAGFPVEAGTVGIMTWIAWCLMFGATGKSAQIPLYVWLPDAMEGPTPVSALIHAATMVTAGIYMVARSNAIFNNAPYALLTVAIIGALTAIMAASIALVQNDIKRVLAYSTVSQLGYMFMACGVAAYSAAIFHLMTHAFFKALLFLSAGSVIHAMSGEQDMRHMGGLRKHIPWTFAVMTIATIAIAGIPPLAGFFSKDEILWKAYSSSPTGWIFWLVGWITAFMTSFYMFRLWFMTFFGELRGPAHDANEEPHGNSTPSQHPHADGVSLTHAAGTAPADLHVSHQAAQHQAHAHGGHSSGSHSAHGDGDSHGVPHESPWVMLAPLVMLAVLCVVGGWFWKPAVFFGENKFERVLAPVFESHKTAKPYSLETSPAHAPAGVLSRENGAQPSPAEANAPEQSHEAQPVVHGGPSSPEASEATEHLLMAASVAAGVLGFLLAWFLYYLHPDKPARIAEAFGGVYRLLVNKYYVDEGYYAMLVNPIVNGSRNFLWRIVDAGIIDGAVNGAGTSASAASNSVRRIQSGNIRSYAGWVAFGACLVLGYMLWTGVSR